MGNRILLHVCCGPCSTSSIERLLSDGWEPVIFYSDSNIWPYEEYRKRFENLLIVAKHYNLEVIEDEWCHDEWRSCVKGHEMDREHGERCSLCFRFNLERAARKAKELGIEHFCTSLTVSRFKNSATIFSQGCDLEGFESIDFKKKNGFQRSIEIAKELGLYRQGYCGCEFSLRDSLIDQKAKQRVN